MSKGEFIVYEDRQYLKNRLAELRAFFEKSAIKGIDVEKIGGLFRSLLKTQADDGSWPDPTGVWTGVQTALALKTLSLLGYTIESSWPISSDNKKLRGGIQKAFVFFKEKKVKPSPKEIYNPFVEDIWDACQVLLAYASYGKHSECQSVVSYLIANWKPIYEESLKNKQMNWRGPAFLAAMLDVFLAYNLNQTRIQDVIAALLKIGKVGEKDYSGFVWRDSDAEPCWHGGLVLRTLASLPAYLLNKQTKSEIFNSLTEALLSETENSNGTKSPSWGKKAIEQFVPMYTARVLEGLTAGLTYIDQDTEKVTDAIEKANQYIFSEIDQNNDYQIYTPKTTIAVAEYFASFTTPAPLGTLIDAGHCLAQQIEINRARSSMQIGYDYFEEVKGGLRIAWLSDLHIAEVKESSMPFMWRVITIKRMKLLRSLFQRTKSYWSEKFASENLDLILKELAEQKPNHILVTGDITNLALEEQFRLARDKFLSHQAKVYEEANGGKLSPDFWTILPGNHDVTKSLSSDRLSEFFNVFGETYPDGRTDDAFPVRKTLRSPASDFELELIGLDSTPNLGVEVVGMNARGRVTQEQKKRLADKLVSSHSKKRFVLVALHHAPLSVPYIKSEWNEFFMSLDTEDAQWLLAQCCTYSVKAILHGHFHTYSPWLAPLGAPEKITGSMHVLGAPCGTTGAPRKGVEFLELREVEAQNVKGTMKGLSVIRHRWENTWTEENLNVLII